MVNLISGLPRCSYCLGQGLLCIWFIDQARSKWLDIGNFFSGKKEGGQYHAILTEKVQSTKDLLFAFRRNFSLGTEQVVPSKQDSSILPAHVFVYITGECYRFFLDILNSNFSNCNQFQSLQSFNLFRNYCLCLTLQNFFIQLS